MKHHKINSWQVKERISPYDFYLREQGLHQFGAKSGGWAVAGLCPFHADRTAGSFKVNLDLGSFICFSCGAKGSDIIAFTMAKHGLSFYEALILLAKEWGGC
jgi:DNA primase